MKEKIGFLLLSVFFLWGCVETPTNNGEEIEEPISTFEEIDHNFFTVDKGPMSARGKGEFTIRSEFEFQSHFGESSNGFDFGEEMMVAIYKGEVPLSEHSYVVTKIIERESDVLVTMKFESCSECKTTPSAPFHVVGMDRTNKRFVFEEEPNN